MNQLFQEANKRKRYLENLLADIEYREKNFPQGKLRVSNDKGVPRYYWITKPKDTRGKYIAKKDHELAHQLAQKDYLQKLYRQVKDELEDIELFLSKHGEGDLENMYTGLNQYRKNMVEPLVISDEMFVEQWNSEQYETNPYFAEEKVYPTKKDELVRSKSEVMLADMYYEMGIPYRYEAGLRLRSGKVKYPDFTLLNIKTRELVYHEHLGLLDNEEYRQANLTKLNEYQKNGIYLGKNLIITYEGDGCYLNIKEIKRMIREIMGCR